MGQNKITERTEKHGFFASTQYYETKLYDRAGRVLARGIGKTERESIDKAYKDLREKGLDR